MDTWFLGLPVTFGVKSFGSKELRAKNGMFDFVHFLRFLAKSLTKYRSKCSKRCTLCALLCNLGFWAKNRGRKVKRFSANMFIRIGYEGREKRFNHRFRRFRHRSVRRAQDWLTQIS